MTLGSYQPNGNSLDRARRRAYLLDKYRADVDVLYVWTRSVGPVVRLKTTPRGNGHPACRCYRCGQLLVDDVDAGRFHVTVDRIIPGCDGGTYRRNNIRPACFDCNSETGGGTRRNKGLPKR